jgi:hypothetical protein
MSEPEPINPRADLLERKRTRVRIFTPSGIVEGDFHHPPASRLSDYLRNASNNERYVLLTSATIRSTTGTDIDGTVSTAPFILISTAHAMMFVPLEAEEAAAA